MNPSSQTPRIGIVIPVYKHSVLVNEAINSILSQGGGTHAITVVVNDGCPLPETAQGIRTMALAYPEKILSLHTPNGGLSAARNRGIQLLLDRYPSIEGIFLLDADNRLDPGSFELFENLLDREPDSDWFYPQFDMFGLVQNASHGGSWSLLMHSADNMCEAGSLVRRRVFDGGVRYDETMRLGYEDWDFWLSAAKHGFRGQAIDQPFFQYRKRPESMLSGSHRVDGEIRSFMRRKHAWLYNARSITAIEHQEAPRARVLFADSGRILALTDPLAPTREINRETFILDAWKWLISPEEADIGAFWITTTEAVWASLEKEGLLRFALWDMERRLPHVSSATLLLRRNRPGLYSISEDTPGSPPHLQAAMVMMGAKLIHEVMTDSSTAWLETMVGASPGPTFSHRVIGAPGFTSDICDQGGIAVRHLFITLMAVRENRYRRAMGMPVKWRKYDYKPRANAALLARSAADSGPLYPVAHGSDVRPSICFLLPIAEFGGVETVALNIAIAMRHRGWRTALCIVGTNPISLADDLQSGFEEVMWFPEEVLLEWGGPVYQGTHLAHAAEGGMARDLVGLLAGFDCVMGCHAAGAVSILGPLRKQGVVTALHEHVMEVSPWGRTYGPPMIAVAHEAALDVIATCSGQLAGWLHANGVPRSKLVPVPNAAGYLMADEERMAFLSTREELASERRLRVLFMGRLDWQKGLDRLASVMRRLQSVNLDVEWRVVGKAVVEDGGGDRTGLKGLVEVEKPVYTPGERSALYAWADVVLMPSRFEGLPLTVFEAQRLGAVPIMTKVGAFNEAIEHGVNGILVNQETCAEEMSEALARLVADRAELRRMSEAAAASERTWDMTAAPLIDRLEAEVARVRKRFSE
jgi:glycosyltransferase involved in cell wall biosynthesis